MSREAGFIYSDMKKEDRKKGITVVCCFSRRWCVKNFFATFLKMHMDMENVHLLLFDNTCNALLEQDLMYWVKVFQGKFLSVSLYKSQRTVGDQNVLDVDRGFEGSKLPMILAMQHDICKLVTTDIFFQTEDDTLCPPNAVPRLVALLTKKKNCGIATAIETGRSFEAHVKTRTGVHYIKMKGDKLIERVSCSPHCRGIQKVDGCGYYCFATYTALWREGIKRLPADMHDMPRFAMDNIHTNYIKLMGFDILADFSLWCIHMNITQTKILFWGKHQAVRMADLWVPRFNTYAQAICLKDPLAPEEKEKKRV